MDALHGAMRHDRVLLVTVALGSSASTTVSNGASPSACRVFNDAPNGQTVTVLLALMSPVEHLFVVLLSRAGDDSPHQSAA